jgi:DNA helicase HerA-like ATPase
MMANDATSTDSFIDPLGIRRRLSEALPVASLAFSVDGRVAHISGPLDMGHNVGDLVVAEPADGPPLIMQIEMLDITERTPLEIDLERLDLGGHVATTAKARPIMRAVEGAAQILGSLTGSGRFAPGSPAPFDESLLRAATSEEAGAMRHVMTGTGGPSIGTALDGTDLPIELKPKGFTRHTFLVGQSGSGKTYTTGVLLESLRLSTRLPIIVLDPNSDHVHLGRLGIDPSEVPESAPYADIPEPVVVASARGHDGDVDLVAHLSDIPFTVFAAFLGLDAIADLEEFGALRRAMTSLESPFSVPDVVEHVRREGEVGSRLAARIDNTGVASWDLWCRPGEDSITSFRLRDHDYVVVDLGSLGRPLERTLVSTSVLGGFWLDRADRQPRLFVIDEAHNVFPANPTTPLERATADFGTLIAGEGRKFGLHLLVATQRPSKVHEQVIAQCDNLILLRMNSRLDVDELVDTFSHVAAGLIRRSPSLSLGQVLYAGPISPVPAFAQTRRRWTPEGGADLPTDWVTREQA